MNDLRVELAREWAKKHNIQLSLFSWQDIKELNRVTKREKRLNKLQDKEKIKEICQGIKGNKGNLDKEEFKQMCKKAGVEPRSLAKTVFTESIEGS